MHIYNYEQATTVSTTHYSCGLVEEKIAHSNSIY